MSTSETFWSRLRRARDQLAAQVLSHPAVTMVDIGLAEPKAGAAPVLRVHMRAGDTSDLKIPQDVDGFVVQIIQADYRMQ